VYYFAKKLGASKLNETIMERRRFTRISLSMAAELTVADAVYPFSQIDNLSVGGCSLETTLAIQQGAACRFWLPLETPAALGIEVHGKIVRCDGTSMSVQFTRITPESLFHLQNLLRFNAHNPDKIEEEINERPGLV